MVHSWTKKIALLSLSALFIASCTKPEFSTDEPFAEEQRDAIYVSAQDLLYALDPNTGAKIWQKRFNGGLSHAPLLIKNNLLLPADITSPDRGYNVYNASTGKLISDSALLKGKTVIGPMVGEGDNAYIPVTYEASPSNPVYNIHAQNYKDQSLLPGNAGNPWIFGGLDNTSIAGSSIILPNSIIVCLRDKISSVSKFDQNAVAWQITGGSYTNPVVDGIHLYVANNNILEAYDINNGQQLWTFTAPDVIHTSPVLIAGNIFFGCDDNNAYAIDSALHTPKWVFKTDERIRSSAYFSNNTVYFGSNDNYFYAVNVKDGSLKWRYRANALIQSSPIVHESTVYVGGFDRNLYAFDTSGRLKWKFDLGGISTISPVLNLPSQEKTIYAAESGMSSQ